MSSPNVISFSLLKSLGATLNYTSARSNFDLIMARVSYVLLDDSNKEKFTSLGGWKAIGTIECRPFVNFNNPESDPVIARPLSSNITRYPLVNEIVVLKVYVSKEAQNNFNNYKPEVYYTDIISLFNAPEENAAPDESYLKLNPNEKYVTGKYAPSGEIKRLIKAPGDITIEGRRGNSIRFGSNMEGFRTPWVAKKNNPIFVISNNQAKTADASARFESINDDGSTLMMMSGHNVSFQPASSNFDSYNTTVTIPEKNNVVVTDQQPKAKPQESLKQEDSKPIPKETPEPTKTPVANPTPVSQQPPTKSDEEQLPEREDLLVIGIDFEDIISSVGTAETKVVDAKALTDAGNKQAQSKTKTTYNKKHLSRAAEMNSRVLNYLKVSQGTGFLEKLTKICNKYAINPADMLTVMAFESGGAWPKGALKDGSKVIAAGLIQFTDAKKNSVFKNIKSQPQFSSLNQLSDILDVPAIKTKNDTSKYNFDQLDLVDFYLSSNKGKLSNPVNGKVDKYAVYGIIFFPEIINNGTISKPDYYVLGSSSKNENYPFLVGSWNPAINGGFPITVTSFKNFVDSLFSTRR